MCTVTFFPLSASSYAITSSRDEVPGRGTIPPHVYHEEGVSMLYPKDERAGGTWIGMSNRKRALTLMNGGFKPHVRKEYYRMSRGLIVLRLLKAENAEKFLEEFDFSEIEPFTIILFDWIPEVALRKIVWTGTALVQEVLAMVPAIWASTQLYTPDLRQLREKWFLEFENKVHAASAADLWRFHHEAGNGDGDISLKIDRGYIHTKSITQIIIDQDTATCLYHDLETNKIQKDIMNF